MGNRRGEGGTYPHQQFLNPLLYFTIFYSVQVCAVVHGTVGDCSRIQSGHTTSVYTSSCRRNRTIAPEHSPAIFI